MTMVSIARWPNGRRRPRYPDAAGKGAENVDERAELPQAWMTQPYPNAQGCPREHS